MDIINIIKKRIKTLETIYKRKIDEIEITKEESAMLGNIKKIEDVNIIVVDELGDKTKKDCFAYENSKCSCLNKLYCKHEKCNFYNNKINKIDLKKAITKYAREHI